jgi:hypothetical protein
VDKLEDIERKVSQLGPDVLARFRQWFAEFDAAAWAARIECDATAGRLDELIRKTLHEHRAGRSRAL